MGALWSDPKDSGALAPNAPRAHRLSCDSKSPCIISPLRRVCVRGPNPAIARGSRDPHGDSARTDHRFGSPILGPVSPITAHFRRLSYIPGAPRYSLALALRMRPRPACFGRRRCSSFPGDPMCATSDPTRRTQGPFAPNTPRVRRFSCIPDESLYNLALTPRMCQEAESGDPLIFQEPMKILGGLTLGADSLILFPFAACAARRRRLSYIHGAPAQSSHYNAYVPGNRISRSPAFLRIT